jgi:glycosyltransferase involved in cell wall biosynthesis
LRGFSAQTITDFDIVIADDGSNDETKEKIDTLKNSIKIPIIHVWHPDNGFQKTKILNKAILAAQSDYQIFTDGDCIPRNDFVERHLEFREKVFFLSGGYFKLPMNISKLITKNVILIQNCFDLEWLTSVGLISNIKKIKLSKSHFLPRF